ncbi:MAG TPA: hypothetical protein VG692_01215 [Gemmatimonadales bacterium]|nr:hypothetical protein [Gemmatimonadales bacterium]
MRARVVGVPPLLLAGLVALLALLVLPARASAGPEPGAGAKRKGFRLFARATGAMTINRVACGLASSGNICTDSTGSAVSGGGFWPKGTADQYVFNSGLQLAGIVGNDGGPWAGDTAGGFLFDPKGTTTHGEEVRPIFNSTSVQDLASWPGAACVPRGDDEANLFHPLLQADSTTGPDGGGSGVPYCRRSASQGDIWFLSWEGNVNLRAGRSHPLGIAVETRGLGWNFPSGNEDILYFVYTFYNITSTNRADYSHIRAPLADILYQKALDLHAGAAAQGVNLPAAGYTINPLFAAFAADMDVSTAGANYSSVNLPFALGYVYDRSFAGAQGWTFDPSIFSAPFFAGSGFVGVKYLSSPSGAGEIQLFSNTINGRPFAGAVNDPRDVVQLYRYLSGTLSVTLGDDPCNTGNPAQTHICFVNNTSPQDMRFFQSSTPLQLGPGQGGSIVVAYIFAAPVETAGCRSNCDVKPGDPLRLTNATQLAQGANLVDSLAGFARYHDDNGDGVVQQGEFQTVNGSLLGKAKVAQGVFDGKFLLPFAPDNPEFFLIPGDNQVTVIWKPSGSEQSGDPFFALASQAQTPDGHGGLVNNILYNPNYRQFDVEGYRIYRGRVDAPNELTLLAQFDYSGTTIKDYTGTVNADKDCAPELGLTTSCAGLQPNLKNGVTLTQFKEYDLVGDIIQVKAGPERVLLNTGVALSTVTDTAVVGRARSGTCGPKSNCPALANTGVPFSFVDHTPRNNFRYFYSVTAFDVNALESGPTSLESPRNTKAVTPVRPAGNLVNQGTLTTHVIGRGVAMDTIIVADPTINPATGVFSGPSRPANGAAVQFAGELARQVLNGSGGFSVTLDSISATGEGEESVCCGGVEAGSPTTYYFTATVGTQTTQLSVPVQVNGNDTNEGTGEVYFTTTRVDNDKARQYGGDSSFALRGTLQQHMPSMYFTNAQTLGCRIGGTGIPAGNECIYNGPRWLDGPSAGTSSPLPAQRVKAETVADPTGGNCKHDGGNNPVCVAVDFNNGGGLTGVTTVHVPQSYTQLIRRWRNVESSLAPYYRAADMNVYWGAGGRIDSVIDITHNVPIPDAFIRNAAGAVTGVRPLGANWGVINTARTNFASTSADGRPGVLTAADFPCFEPMRSIHASPQAANSDGFPCAPTGNPAYVPGGPFTPDTIVTPGQVAFFKNAPPDAAGAAPVANGFGLYVAGTFTLFQLPSATPPAAGTIWTLRTYAGMIRGGKGPGGGDTGLPYTFTQADRPFTVVGAKVEVAFDVVNLIRAPRFADLRQVHTVPDPYYVTNEYEQSTDLKVIKFVNLPDKAIIRIYSASGVLVNILENPGPTCANGSVGATGAVAAVNATGGECTWNVRNRNNQVVASGVYFYHIESNSSGGTARRVGRMTIVNFAQ